MSEVGLRKDEVAVKNSTGQITAIPVSELSQALQQGMTLADPNEFRAADIDARYGTAGQAALATLEGLGRGVSLGVSDTIARGLGADMEAMQLRREVNSPLATGAEVLGALAPILLTEGAGATGLLARSAALPTRGVMAAGGMAERLALEAGAGRLVAGAARGVVEGGLYGAGQAMSQEALQDRDLTAEKLLAGVGHGALLGGVLGAGMGAMSKPMRSLDRVEAEAVGDTAAALSKEGYTAQAAELKGIRAYAQEFADRKAYQSLGGMTGGEAKLQALAESNPEAAKLVPQLIHDELPQMVGKSSLAGVSYQTGELAAKKLVKAKGEQIGEMMKAFDGVATAEERPFLGRIRRIRDTSEADAIHAEIAQKKSAIQAIEDSPLRRGASELPALKQSVGELETRLKAVGKGEMKLVGEGELATKVLDYINGLGEKFGGPKVQRQLLSTVLDNQKAMKASGFEALHRLRADIDRQINFASKGMKLDTSEALRGLRGIIEDEIESRAAAVADRTGMANSYVRAKQEYAAAKTIADAAKIGAKHDRGRRSFSLGDHLFSMAGLAGGGFVGAIGAGAVSNLIRNRGDQLAATLANNYAKGRSLNVLSNVWSTVDDRIQNAVGKMLNVAKPTVQRTAKQTYEQTAPKVMQAMANPGKFAQGTEKALIPVANVNRDIALSMRETFLRGMQFLSEKLPQAQERPTLTPFAQGAAKPTEADMRMFAQYAEGVQDPISVLRDVEKGTLTREKVEAVKVVWPKLYGYIQEQVMAKVMGRQTPLPYAKRLQLGLLLDLPTDATLAPQFIRTMQVSAPAKQLRGGRAPRVSTMIATEIQKI